MDNENPFSKQVEYNRTTKYATKWRPPFMLFGRKKSAETIFTGHYKTMLEIAKASAIAQNPEFELLPAMFVITDYAAASARKDRRSIANEVIRAMKSAYKGFDNALLDKRCELYGEIIRGKKTSWRVGPRSCFCL